MKGTVKGNKCTEFLFACGYLRKKKITFFATACVAVGGGLCARNGAGTIKSIGKLRSMVRVMLKDKLEEIDVLVKEILG